MPGQMMPGQMNGQQMQGPMFGQQGQMLGQMNGQQMQGPMFGQMQGRMPGQMQGQMMPGQQMQGRMPGQMMPGQQQMQGQMPFFQGHHDGAHQSNRLVTHPASGAVVPEDTFAVKAAKAQHFNAKDQHFAAKEMAFAQQAQQFFGNQAAYPQQQGFNGAAPFPQGGQAPFPAAGGNRFLAKREAEAEPQMFYNGAYSAWPYNYMNTAFSYPSSFNYYPYAATPAYYHPIAKREAEAEAGADADAEADADPAVFYNNAYNRYSYGRFPYSYSYSYGSYPYRSTYYNSYPYRYSYGAYPYSYYY